MSSQALCILLEFVQIDDSGALSQSRCPLHGFLVFLWWFFFPVGMPMIVSRVFFVFIVAHCILLANYLQFLIGNLVLLQVPG